MNILHGLMRRLNITTTMIQQILAFRVDHKQRRTENGDTLQSDKPSMLDC